MPTEYFEAKPQRAVRFDEVVSVVIPDNSSTKLINSLDFNNINYETYKSGDENDRLNVVNKVADEKDIRWSKADEDVQSQLTEREKLEDKAYSMADTEYYNSRFESIAKISKKHEELLTDLQYKLESVHFESVADMSKVKKVLRKIISNYGAKGLDVDKMSKTLAEAYNNYNSVNGVTYAADEILDAITDEIINAIDDAEITQEAKETLAMLSNMEFRLSERQKEYVKEKYGSVGAFYRKAFGKLKIRNNATSTLDMLWEELSDPNNNAMAYMFEEVVNDLEMPIALLEIFNSIKNGGADGQFKASSRNLDEEKEFLRMELREGALHVASKGDILVKANKTLAQQSDELWKELVKIKSDYEAERDRMWKEAYDEAFADLSAYKAQADDELESAADMSKVKKDLRRITIYCDRKRRHTQKRPSKLAKGGKLRDFLCRLP